MKNFLQRLFAALFYELNPEDIALRVKGLLSIIYSGFGAGIIDVLVQFLGVLQSEQTAFVINWQLVARTVGIAVLIRLIPYLRILFGKADESPHA